MPANCVFDFDDGTATLSYFKQCSAATAKIFSCPSSESYLIDIDFSLDAITLYVAPQTAAHPCKIISKIIGPNIFFIKEPYQYSNSVCR